MFLTVDEFGPSDAADEAGLGFWVAACLLLVAALTIPFVMVDVPPVLDYPNHLAGFYILAHPTDPVISRFYAPRWALLPNVGADVLGALLLKVLPVHVAGRIVLATSLAAPIAGTVIYARAAFGRLTFWSLGSGLAAYNGLFFLGFMNFLIGLGLALAGAGVWTAARRRGPMQAAAAGAACSTLVYFCHLSALAFFAILIGAWETEGLIGSRARQPRQWLTALAVVAVSLAPAALLYLASPLAGAPGAIAYRPWLEKLLQLDTPFLTYDLLVSLLTLAAVCLVIGYRGVTLARGAWLTFAALAALYVVTPGWMKGGAFVDTRIPVMAGFLLFAALSPRLSPRAGSVTAAVLCALLVVRTGQVAVVWFDHRRDLAQFRDVIGCVPPGAKVIATYGYGGDPTVDRPPGGLAVPGLYPVNMHMPALLVIERHAFWPLLFSDPRQQPLMVRAPYDRLAFPLGELFDAHRLADEHPSPTTLVHAPYLPAWRKNFDYVLLLNASQAPLNATPPTSDLDVIRINQTAALYAIHRPYAQGEAGRGNSNLLRGNALHSIQ